jgi:hypothetical protein
MVFEIARTGFVTPTGKNYMTAAKIIVRVVPMTEYYDYVLGFVPLALVGITGVLGAAGVDFPLAVLVGAATASLAVGHALFVNGPVQERTTVDEAPVHSSTAADRSPVNAD